MSRDSVVFPYAARTCLTAWLVLLFALPATMSAQGTNSLSTAGAKLTAPQIVVEMEHQNKRRLEELRHYHSVRHYDVSYKGLAKIAAGLVVEVNYDAASGKTFRIISQSGSKLLVDKVLKKLVESEQDAGGDKYSTALTQANYDFQLDGIEDVGSRPAYILTVEPKVDSKYLYRGKIWVDTADFAVAKIAAEPAKNPSFWISKTAINHRYVRIDGFWLPAQNRSESKVRVGGSAVLSIDYGKYDVEPQAVVAGVGR
jgi:hypothetical protein